MLIMRLAVARRLNLSPLTTLERWIEGWAGIWVTLNTLSATAVRIAKPGKYNDGLGLWLAKRADVIQGGLPGGIGRTGASIPPETRNSNLRRLHAYRCFLESHEEWAVQTVDEHLRAVARMSAFFGHKPSETITIADVCRLKEPFRHLRDVELSAGLSKSTVVHTQSGRAAALAVRKHPDSQSPTNSSIHGQARLRRPAQAGSIGPAGSVSPAP